MIHKRFFCLLVVLCVLGAAKSITDGSGSVIGVRNGTLYLYDREYKFVGWNSYSIGTMWGINAGCGGEFSDQQLDVMFSLLPPDSLVCFWVWQGTIVTNINTKEPDWYPVDRVFNISAKYGQRLVVVMTSADGSCDDGHYRDITWYQGGYKDVFNNATNSNGLVLTPLSYWDYVQLLVNRYKDHPALGIWEPISEGQAVTCPPENITNCDSVATCPNETAAAEAMRSFFDEIGGMIHSLDPYHLISNGLIGGGQCGTAFMDYEYVSASPGIDILSYHDYYPANEAIGGDQWNGLQERFSQSRNLKKPIFAGESGIVAGGPGCDTFKQRAIDYKARLNQQIGNGTSGILFWNYMSTNTSKGDCSYDTWLGDDVINLIINYPAENNWSDYSPTTSSTNPSVVHNSQTNYGSTSSSLSLFPSIIILISSFTFNILISNILF